MNPRATRADLMGQREDIITACKKLEADGLNRGASGNVSMRDRDHMLITPSAVGYDVIAPDMIARMRLDDDSGGWEGPNKPSSEWRFHRDILRGRSDINAVVHTHAPYATILAIARKPIPAVHYMIAAFGGPDIRVCDYARYGTAELSEHILVAMEGRNGCLMANHGMVVGASDLTRALWLAGELEALAHQYVHTLAIGGPVLLSDAEIEETAKGFESYGVQAKDTAQ
ncbi:class II aldolase/adducin family protein [Roseobacter denitrificans]|nr:class II aldolase/adducin family protein [Roseobacter denitrificans]